MKFTCIAFILSLAALGVFSAPAIRAEDNDAGAMEKLLAAQNPNLCHDYAGAARHLIPGYYRQGKLDSIDAIIRFVTERCPQVEFRTYRTLREIQLGNATDRLCEDSVVLYILLAVRQYRGIYEEDFFGICRFNPARQFDDFLMEMAAETRDFQDPHSLAHAVAVFHAEGVDAVEERLADGAYEGTCLQQRYDRRIDSLLDCRRDGGVNWSLNIGAWIPFGNLDLVGNKVEFGAQGGYRWRRLGFDLTWLGRVSDSKNPYLVNHNDSLRKARRFFSMYMGVDPVVRVLTGRKTSLEFFGGVGYEGIMALNSEDNFSGAPDYIHSLGLNGGLTLRLFYGRTLSHFVGLQTRVSRLDYGTGEGGSPMSGGAVVINLIWGGMPHGNTDDMLERMHYYRD